MRTTLYSFVFFLLGYCLPLNVFAQIDPLLERARPTESTDTTRGTVFTNRVLLSGRVLDAITKEPLPGAIIRLQNSPVGALTDANGKFIINILKPGNVVLVITYTGYSTKMLVANPKGGTIQVMMEEGEIVTDQVVVSASRVPQQLKEASVSITKLSMADISRNPALNVYESFQQVKELEGLNVGIGYKVYNARGFLALVNNRFLQRYDGIDMLIPGNNATVGNLVGIPDLDVQNAEILVGSASVLYGSTAINGLLNITSRSAFEYPGFTSQIRTGINHIGNPISEPTLFQEIGFRYAKVFDKSLAAKLVVSAFRGNDWIADNDEDGANYQGTTNSFSFKSGRGNPGYDGTSVFGDEAFYNFSYLNFFKFSLTPGVTNPIDNPNTILRVSRSGYSEYDLVDYDFLNVKGLFSITKRFRGNVEASYTANLGIVNTMTPLITRDRLENFVFQHHKLELLTPRLSVRLYASLQSNPSMINLTATAGALNRAVKSDNDWLTQYIAVFGATNGEVNRVSGRAPYSAGSDAAARSFANSNNQSLSGLRPSAAYLQSFLGGGARLEPGTSNFDRVLDSVKKVRTTDGGGRISDYTSFVNLEWQYGLLNGVRNKTLDLNIGGSYRNYFVRSFGSFYSDSPESGFNAFDYGFYVNALSRVAGGAVNLNLSARLDGNQSISPKVSPRASVTINIDDGRVGFVRASAQRTFRLPNLVQQFQDLNLGVYRQIGPSRGVPQRYGIAGEDNNYTLASIQTYTSTFLTGETNSAILETYDISELRPERVTSYEVGFRTSMKPGSTYIDFALFYNQFDDFIGLVPVVGKSASANLNTPLNASLFNVTDLANYQVWSNIPNRFSNYGYSIGVDIAFSESIRLNTNGSFIWFQGGRTSSTIALVDLYNTPVFKANSLLTMSHFYKNFNFSVNHRWSDTYEFQVPSFSSQIAAFNVVDAAISYDFSGYQIKLGGTNVLNHYHVEIIYGPSIGAAYFVQVTVDPYLFPRRNRR